MFQYDEEEEKIFLCINCDAEYTITKIDDGDEEPKFCPFCGYEQEEDSEDEEDFDDDESAFR